MTLESKTVERLSTPRVADGGSLLHWHTILMARYGAEVEPDQTALWRRAAALLVQHGDPRISKDGRWDAYPKGAALSTGLLAVGGVWKRHGVPTVNAVRLSIATPELTYRQLPRDRGHNTRDESSPGFNRAVLRLAAFPGLHAIRLDAMKLAKRRQAFVESGVEPSVVREVIPPRMLKGDLKSGANYGHLADERFNAVLADSPEVAMWGVPLKEFCGAYSMEIRRPRPPEVVLARSAPASAWRRAIEEALMQARNEQPDTLKALDMLKDVTMPVRSLGGIAVVTARDVL